MFHELAAADPEAQPLLRWKRWFTPLVVVASVLPLASMIGGSSYTGVEPWIIVSCWLVLVVDFIAHVRLRPGFLSLPAGKLYLAIIVVTTPLYLVTPWAARTDLLVLARLAWVVRLVAIAIRGMRGIHRLISRLGKTVLYAALTTAVAAVIVDQAEDGADGFDSFGDSLWWAIVTVTSVGYGDLVPETTTGRVTAAFLMVAGVAIIGAIAASLASFLGMTGDDDQTSAADVGKAAAEPGTADHEAAIAGELTELRREISRLAKAIDERG